MCAMALNAGSRAHHTGPVGGLLVATPNPLPASPDSSEKGQMCQMLTFLASPATELQRVNP